MKKNSRLILVVGLALLCAVVVTYIRRENSKSRAVSKHKARLIAEENETKGQAKSDAPLFYRFKRIRFESHIIRQPVSEEIKKRAAELDINISPFFDSEKVVNLLIPPAKTPLRNSGPEFARLLEESRATDAEVAEEKAKWWERNGERYVKEGEQYQEFLRTNPEVAEEDRRYEKRKEEISAMQGISMAEFSKLEYEAVAEHAHEIFEIRKKLFANTVPPAGSPANQQK